MNYLKKSCFFFRMAICNLKRKKKPNLLALSLHNIFYSFWASCLLVNRSYFIKKGQEQKIDSRKKGYHPPFSEEHCQPVLILGYINMQLTYPSGNADTSMRFRLSIKNILWKDLIGVQTVVNSQRYCRFALWHFGPEVQKREDSANRDLKG